ncbi:MAG: hypothetical protein ABI847_13375 [Anaerolineales bacterium]
MTLFNNRYRVPSARLKDWDYTRPGAYFVTLCTAQRQSYLGQIAEGQMRLSPIGAIVADE